MDWFTELFRAVKTNQMRAEATHTVAKLLDYKVSVDVRNSAFNKVCRNFSGCAGVPL